MNCKEFKNKYQEYSKFPLSKEVCDTEDYEEWRDHLHNCDTCSDWEIEQVVINRGHNPTEFPCIHIAYYITKTCKKHPDPWNCPDILLVKTSDGYGIPIRDGGSSMVQIDYCPWCGTKLQK
ncbi:DUF6980 family protein [Thiolapillus brandeum]|uniref:DUF6980 family protein n=1 Tax=Thiolapillus brandeum TaxID=1076588 RepID=UPI001CB782B6|nr:hypothetical protein [Thiolapillus brandeum]